MSGSAIEQVVVNGPALEKQGTPSVSAGKIDAAAACTPKELRTAVKRFTAWLDRNHYASYDPYDIWGTAYGRVSRRLYYAGKPAGKLLTAPLILAEIVCPAVPRWFIAKNRYATGDAQLGLAFLNLHQLSASGLMEDAEETTWMARAKDLAADLLHQSVPGYRGHCWGYPFDWQNVNGLMPKNTPHITATPYCYELFTRLFEVTGERRYLDIARSIATFVAEDLKDTSTGKEAAASSYTPYDSGKVVNASAYRAYVLSDAAWRFGNESLKAKAQKNIRFILDSQQADGSWLYAIDNPNEAFIDHFHTCFVLKNLYKANRSLQSQDVERAIRRGYEWYRQALFDEKNNPRSFAIAPRREIVRVEMYNFAEAISLGVLLRNEIPEAFGLAQTLAARLIRDYTLPAGHWVTRVYRGGIRHTLPFLRWPQAQLFYSLTNVLLACDAAATAT